MGVYSGREKRKWEDINIRKRRETVCLYTL